MIDLNRVQMFAQVIEQGSFTAAAKKLGLTKATVSRKVAELENDAGVQLIHRTTRALKLTDAGAEYYNKVRQILQDIYVAEAQLGANQELIKGELKIVCPIELGQLFLAKIFSKFLVLYPDIELNVELSNRSVDMEAEGVDFTFKINDEASPKIKTYRLTDTKKMLVVSPSYLKHHPLPKHPNELPHHKGVKLSSAHTSDVMRIFNGNEWQEVDFQTRYTVNNVTLAREAAIDGLGIALIPNRVAAEALKNNELIQILPDFPIEQSYITINFLNRTYIPRKYVAFIEFIFMSLIKETADPHEQIVDWPEMISKPEEWQKNNLT